MLPADLGHAAARRVLTATARIVAAAAAAGWRPGLRGRLEPSAVSDGQLAAAATARRVASAPADAESAAATKPNLAKPTATDIGTASPAEPAAAATQSATAAQPSAAAAQSATAADSPTAAA